MLDWLAQRAQVSPQKPALIFAGQQWSYRQLNEWVATLAAQLFAAGVGQGQYVAVLMPNRPEMVALIHGLARLGAVLVPLNIRLTATELRWQVSHIGCQVIICDQETEALATELKPKMLLSVDAPLTTIAAPLITSTVSDQAAWSGKPLQLDAVQGIVFTSGTTGYPKGAMLTFSNHFWSATASAWRLDTISTDRWLLCMPLYHVGGMAIVLRCCLYGTTVILQRGFQLDAVALALKTQHVSLLSVVPTMLHRLLEMHADALTSARLRCILVGGAAASPALLAQCLALKLPVAPTYGLTEAASQVATATPLEAAAKPGSVGKPLMFSQVRIVNGNGRPLPAGEIGEIVVSGPMVMKGYFTPDAGPELEAGQGLSTGDMGYLDVDGDLWVIQRRADLIISGGENVYPVEVENALQHHPAVQDACVVGLGDTEWGQLVAAAVVIQPNMAVTEPELLAFCQDRLAGYKQPRKIMFTQTLPQTASGKIRRDEVRRWMQTQEKLMQMS